MKLIKYNNINKIYKLAYKEALSLKPKDERKKIKRNNIIKNICGVSAFIFHIIIFILFVSLINLIPEPENKIILFFYWLLYGLLCIIAYIISVIVIFYPVSKIVDKYDFSEPIINRDNIKNACDVIRKHYQLTNNYIVSKCFFSNNYEFKNKDLCIFRVGKEIRITNNIIVGYLDGKSNLGCYKVKFDELKVYKDNYDEKQVTIIEFENEKFITTSRVYPFIRRLMNVKVYKFLNEIIELDERSITFRKKKSYYYINLKDIKEFIFTIPKYSSVPGSGYDYSYRFKIIDNDNNKYLFSTVLERHDEKEIISHLKKNKINLKIYYRDNRNTGD